MDGKMQDGRAMLIRDMLSGDRPREKAIKYGIKSLSDTELMAIIFSTGVQGKSVVQLSNEILADSGGHLSKVARLTVNEFLKRYKGIGPAKAVSLLAALELGARAGADAATVNDPQVLTSADAAAIMRPQLARLSQEEFWAMYLTSSARIIKCVNISRGGVATTAVDIRMILKHGIDNLASSMIVFHNHPSGNLVPSVQDDALTRKIKEGSAFLDIHLVDHIIITDGGYYSYNVNGRL